MSIDFSQVKTILIELEVLKVQDVTHEYKLMMSALVGGINTSGNMSGNWGSGMATSMLSGDVSGNYPGSPLLQYNRITEGPTSQMGTR